MDSSDFHELSEVILAQIEDTKYLAKCAEVASKRQPGGGFYRAKSWAKISQLLEVGGNEKILNSELSQLCQLVGLHPNTAKGYIIQGKAIESVEKSFIST